MIIKRSVARLKRNQLYFVKSAFRNWILAGNVAKKATELKVEL
jgi:hypothetical protein